MQKTKNTYVFYFIVVSYILVNAYILLFDKGLFYLYNLLPLFLFVILLAVLDIEKIMYIMVFSTPLAISLKELGMSNGLNLSLPSEPLMIGMTLIYILNEISHGITDKKILKHPITIIILIQLLWMVITSIFSELPIISVKYILSRIWFLTSCYFMATLLFKNQKKIVK